MIGDRFIGGIGVVKLRNLQAQFLGMMGIVFLTGGMQICNEVIETSWGFRLDKGMDYRVNILDMDKVNTHMGVLDAAGGVEFVVRKTPWATEPG